VYFQRLVVIGQDKLYLRIAPTELDEPGYEGQELLRGAVLLLTIAEAATAHADFLKG
jgi:hypothetical protein